MNIALCAVFLEEDIWGNYLREATFSYKVEITEYNSAEALLPVLDLKSFSLLTVVLNGQTGLKAIEKLRAKAPSIPILWISNEDFSLFGYEHRVTCFLRRPVGARELREAVAGCLGLTREKVMKKGKRNIIIIFNTST